MGWIAALGFTSAGLGVLSGFAGKSAADQSAANARADAEQARVNAGVEAERTRTLVENKQSTFRAAVGSQGTTFEGSPMLAYIENAKAGEMEAQDAIFAGEMKRRSRRAESDIYRRQGDLALLSGIAQGGTSLASTLLKTA